MIHLGDITKLNGAEIPVVDCITGGSPCQDLSVAGKRAGLDGERSGLFMEQVRIVKEMRAKEIEDGRTAESVRPRWMVWENVPGAFSSNGGKDFQAVLTEIVRIVNPECPDVPMPKDGKWSKAGCLYDELGRWSVAWRVHDAQFWGVPQRRKRIALVADFGGMCATEVLFERKGLSGDSIQGNQEREASSGCAKNGFGKSIKTSFSAGFKPRNGAKTYTIGYGEEVSLTINTDGNYSALAFQGSAGAEASLQLGENISPTLNVTKCAMVLGADSYNQTLTGNESKTLNSIRSDSDHVPVVISSSNTNATVRNDDVCPSLLSRAGTGGNNTPIATCGSTVRRLTPVECERLQGYPDGWTDIGEWIDTNGTKHKDADSPRYKALGNSIATPFWFYLLRRISATYERPATLGSLFDGIGGFPYCWERCNGKGTAVWASEIEEFPIAVTKIRFPE